MIIIIYGTTGELIKLLPLIRDIPYEKQFRISTQQQPLQLKGLHDEANAPVPNCTMANGKKGHDLEKISDMLFWIKDIVFGYIRARKYIKNIKKENKNNLVIVHGDTVTTVIGALIGKLHRIKVAHIEAGLRSGNWRHPFPEEIDRRITSKIAKINYAPGDIPVSNLMKAKVSGEIVNTKFNTVLDSLKLASLSNLKIKGLSTIPSKYFIVSIHRNELMSQPSELKRTLENISNKSKDIDCIFLDHPVTKEKIRTLNFDNIIDGRNITRLNKLRYFQFITLISKADFIITDSGGLQEEAYYLGIPCLVHRLTTERDEGLGKNVVLSKYDNKAVVNFLNKPNRYRTKSLSTNISPTKLIIKDLINRGYLS